MAFLQSVTELRLKDRVIVSNLQKKLKAHPRAAVLSSSFYWLTQGLFLKRKEDGSIGFLFDWNKGKPCSLA